MPINLLKNSKIEFICCRDFVYAGVQYHYGEDFPQEIGNNVETLVRSRYIIPVVEKWEDKPRHWHQHVRLKSQALELMERKSGTQIDLNRPADIPTSPLVVDNGETIRTSMMNNIERAREEDPDMAKHEVTFIDGNEESEPPAMVNPDAEHEPEIETKMVEEPEIELSEEQEELLAHPQGVTDYNPDGTATSTHDYSDQEDASDEDRQQLKDDTSARNDTSPKSGEAGATAPDATSESPAQQEPTSPPTKGNKKGNN